MMYYVESDETYKKTNNETSNLNSFHTHTHTYIYLGMVYSLELEM